MARYAVMALIFPVLTAAIPAGPLAQEAQPALRFEVASVKPSQNAPGGGPPVKGRLMATGVTLDALITRVYGIRPSQLEGGPSWLRSERFDISAKAPGDSATEAEMFEMIKQLLADRFGLRVRFDTRQDTVYKLRLARSDGRFGPALTRATAECQKAIETKASAARGPGSSGLVDPLKPICGVSFASPVAGNAGLRLTMGGIAIAQLIQRLTNDLAAPVLDETGLGGLFDLVLEYERVGRVATPSTNADPATELPPPPLQAALEQQLGLKLEREAGPVQILTIENVQRPTPD